MKKALIFDVDGVIVDNYKFHIRSWQEFTGLVFEDSHHGIEAANRAGMKVVAVATEKSVLMI